MPKVTAPLLSFGASGQIGNAQVYAKWRGIQYARRYAIPANPKTTRQLEVRASFAWLNSAWLYMPASVLAPWNAAAAGKPLLGRNVWQKNNQPILGGDPQPSDITGLIFSPGANGGLPPASISLTAGSTQITCAVTAPDIPTGWTLSKAHAATLIDQDPADPFAAPWTAGEDASDPYSIVLTGLTASSLYVVGAWLEWTKPDGSTAYGTALTDTATPTA